LSLSRETIAAVRFGYGFRPGEAVVAEPEAMLAGVRSGAGSGAGEAPGLSARVRAYERIRQQAERPEGRQRAARRLQAFYEADVERRVAESVLSPHGFYERLVWFWADHFTVVGRGGQGRLIAPSFEVEAIRPNVGARFAGLLRAAVTHPVMLVYLDQHRSVGPNSPAGRRRGQGLNENLAREVLELHTLGVEADYGQEDVRQFAELLTGLGADLEAGAATFRPRRAEPGAETVLGLSYGGRAADLADVHAVLEDLAVHPATARHIAQKLAVHFVADPAPEALVAHLEAAFTASDGDLMAVYAALLEHPAAWGDPGAKVRQPFEFLVASLRASGPGDAGELAPLLAIEGKPGCVAALAAMNQPLWGAAGPDGWPEAAEAWITAPGLAARINRASRIGEAIAERTDPRAFLDGALGELAREETSFVVQGAAERWEGIALAMASPEFNRR
jgi:uncharacterized protein (DUF1800 family)